ncbi:response regulator [Mesorhizobium sp. ZC-5]|uniref:response regulator n=1 Tax=Mesorhizobium sp. ZC-5 TaxID=2986066 RepID=UPI0021E79BB6|nr:response regulator [Mesorhizobium sp. ZC-5]MCV3238694.1 response regulator [Mesorhizobium sp. ZC-5]
MSKPLKGLRVLILEDEFLIAMDVEQLCRDSGAEDVFIVRSLQELAADMPDFDVAIVDLMLSGVSTLDFARQIYDRGVPFVFASGYTDLQEITEKFPNISVIGKPYAGEDLIGAVTAAVANRNSRQSLTTP